MEKARTAKLTSGTWSVYVGKGEWLGRYNLTDNLGPVPQSHAACFTEEWAADQAARAWDAR